VRWGDGCSLPYHSKMSKRSSSSKHVSCTPATLRAEKLPLDELVVICEVNVDRSNKSVVWQYFGRLYHSPASAGNDSQMILLDEDRLYCRYN